MTHERWEAVHDWAGLLTRRWMTRFHDHATTSVLDVGACWGKYRELLPEYAQMDAVEIWTPTINEENLRGRYRTVWPVDIFDFVHSDDWNTVRYDVVIFGDVLEHMTRERAKSTLRQIYPHYVDVIVVVPYMYEQDEEDGNPYQAHLQSDLTPELMAAEYPELQLIALDTREWLPFKGLYVRSLSGDEEEDDK